MKVVEIAAEETHELRRLVLREGRADAEVRFPQDDRPGAFHLGVLDPGAGRLVAVATLFPDETPWRPGQAAWRLRGMAVAPERQGSGVGRLLLDEALVQLRVRGATVLWANARDTAIPFYERLGMEVVGDGFLEIGIPHHVVVLDL